MRLLGHATMSEWATQAEVHISDELRSQDPTVLSRKKNAEVVVCLWIGGGARADLVQPNPELPAAIAQAIGSYCAGTVSTTGTGADGLWLRACLCQGGAKCSRALWIRDWGQRRKNRHFGTCPPGA